MKRFYWALAIFISAVMTVSCATIDKQVLEDGRTVYGKTDRKSLEKKDSIRGRILDYSTNKPVTNAIVEIKNVNFGMGYYRLKSDSRGYFKIDDFIRKVRYRIEITAEGYVPYIHTSAIQSGNYTFYIHQEGIIHGTVRDSSGSPMSGVTVKINRRYSSYSYDGMGRKPVIAETDTKGRYRINKLPEGSYLVYFEKDGYITESARIKKIKRGESFDLPMRLYRPASISGKLIIEGIKTPAINVDVILKGKTTHSASSYHDGSYQLYDLKPGNYRIRISHQGFYKMQTPILTIREGAQRKNLNFTVKPKSPEVLVYAHRYTFVPGTKVELNLKTFRLEKVRVKIYKVPMALLVNGRTDPNDLDPGRSGFRVIEDREQPVKDFMPYEWRYQYVGANKALPNGGYCIEVSGAGRVVDRKFFTVTSVGVVIKRSQTSVFAYVSSLVENKPLKDARVVLFDNTPSKKKYRYSHSPYKPPRRIEDLPVRIITRGKTDANGIFHYRKKSDLHLSVLVVGTDGSYAFCNTGSPYQFKKEQEKYFIYTDRPVYRAGDTVYYKIVGKRRANRFKPIKNRKLHYRIVNRDMNETLKEGTLRLDEWGTYNKKITLKADTHLGEYEIRVGPSPDNLYANGVFYAEQYRKPEFKIDLTPSRSYFINGDTVEFKVEGKYFFGAPLKGALLKYRFYETRLRDTDTTYWWEEDYGETASYYRIKLEGEKYLDDSGMTVLKLFAGNFPYDREITLETTIVDKSNISITSRSTVKVGRGEFFIKINPLKNFYADNEKKKIELKALTHDGKPVRTDIKIQVFRYIWKPYQRVYVHDRRPIMEKQVAVGKKGSTVFELPKKLNISGEFDIVASAQDRRDNIITASRVVWIYNPYGARVASRFKNLELSVNTEELPKPGPVTCLIKSRFSDAYVCLTLEGRDIYDKKVVKMKGNILPVTLNIKKEYAPNLYIHATMQRNRALFTSTARVSLPYNDTALTITMKPDKKKYLPGEKSRVQIMVKDENNKPVMADLSLGVVDESIYHIRRDHTPKMKDFYYTKISNWVSTSYSYPITLLAGAGKDGKVKVRSDFKDTAYWKANIRTDRNGMSMVTFKLPDNLTTWRLTSRAHDRAGRVGENKNHILVTQDLIARIGKPRFLIEGDELNLIGIVNSNSDRGLGKVELEMTAEGRKLNADKEQKVSLPPYGSARMYYPLKVPESKDKMALQFQAIGDRDAKDALRVNIPVESKGVAYKFFGVGDMAVNRKVEVKPLGDTENFVFKPEELSIVLNPGPIAHMLRASEYLSRYPYGCVEQTINSFLPNLALKRLLEQKGLQDLMTIKKLEDKIRVGIARVQRAQNDDGSWGWWSGDRGNEFLTGYALYSFYTLKKLGYQVDKATVNHGVKAISRMFRNRSKMGDDEKAYLLYIYSLYGRWHTGVFKSLADKKTRSVYQLSFLIRAMNNAKHFQRYFKNEYREKLSKLMVLYLKDLKSQQKKDSKGLFWTSMGSTSWGWQGSPTEITAHVLSTLAESGDRSTIQSQIVTSLSKRAKSDAWNSTKETATVFFAFCSYLEKQKGAVSQKAKVNFKLEGKNVAEISYDTSKLSNIRALEKKIKLDKNNIKSSYTIEALGNAGPDVSFNCVLKGNLYFKDKGFLSLLKSEDRSLIALENGIGLARNFYSIQRVKDMNNNEYMVPQEIKEKKYIKIGDEILVKIKFKARDNFEYLILEDYLPSGFEVINKNAYDEYRPYAHIERWDNRMVLFFSKIKKDSVYEVAYIIRAELPGKFLVKPSRMECMYEPSIQGWSLPTKFDVEKK